jgi:hypothetical protein
MPVGCARLKSILLVQLIGPAAGGGALLGLVDGLVDGDAPGVSEGSDEGATLGDGIALVAPAEVADVKAAGALLLDAQLASEISRTSAHARVRVRMSSPGGLGVGVQR